MLLATLNSIPHPSQKRKKRKHYFHWLHIFERFDSWYNLIVKDWSFKILFIWNSDDIYIQIDRYLLCWLMFKYPQRLGLDQYEVRSNKLILKASRVVGHPTLLEPWLLLPMMYVSRKIELKTQAELGPKHSDVECRHPKQWCLKIEAKCLFPIKFVSSKWIPVCVSLGLFHLTQKRRISHWCSE